MYYEFRSNGEQKIESIPKNHFRLIISHFFFILPPHCLCLAFFTLCLGTFSSSTVYTFVLLVWMEKRGSLLVHVAQREYPGTRVQFRQNWQLFIYFLGRNMVQRCVDITCRFVSQLDRYCRPSTRSTQKSHETPGTRASGK